MEKQSNLLLDLSTSLITGSSQIGEKYILGKQLKRKKNIHTSEPVEWKLLVLDTEWSTGLTDAQRAQELDSSKIHPLPGLDTGQPFFFPLSL